MKKTAGLMQSGLKLAFLQCAGALPEDQRGDVADLDAEYCRRDKVAAVLTSEVERITDDKVKALVTAVLYGNTERVSTALTPYLPVAHANGQQS